MSLIERAKERFGITKNPEAAGYVLPDGSMLNFRRNHRKLIGHGFIKWVFEEDLSLWEGNLRFMRETGSIRIMKGLWPSVSGPGKETLEELGFYWEGVATIKPTAAQARVIGRICRLVEGLSSWSLLRPDGSTCEWVRGFGTWPGYMRAFERAKSSTL